MANRSRVKTWLVGLALAAFGVACLNYVAGGNHEHHVEWATEHGLPAPSPAVFFLGAALAVLGGVLIGRGTGKRSA